MSKTNSTNHIRLIILLSILGVLVIGAYFLFKQYGFKPEAAVVSGTKFYMTSPKPSYNLGESFTVSVIMDTATVRVSGADVKIDFENQYLQVVDANGNPATTIGTGDAAIFPLIDVNSVFTKPGDSTKNTIALTRYFSPGSGGSFIGNGAQFATIRFKVIKIKATPSAIAFQFTPDATNDTNMAQFGGQGNDVLATVGNLSLNLVDVPATVNIVSSKGQVVKGSSVLLTWTVSNATGCTASGDWTGTKNPAGGTETVGPLATAKTYNYILTCLNVAGTPTSKTVAVVSTEPPLANLTFSLQARASAAISGATLKVFNPGTSVEAIPAKTNLSSVSTPGHINNVDVNGLALSSNYDFVLYVNSYLAGKALNSSVAAFPLNLTFSELKGGDLNGSGLIDAIDYSLWKSKNSLADINADTAINSIDLEILSGNWTP